MIDPVYLQRLVLEFQPQTALREDEVVGAVFSFYSLKLCEGLHSDSLVAMATMIQGWPVPLVVHPGSLRKPRLGEVWGCNVDGRGFVWPMIKLEG